MRIRCSTCGLEDEVDEDFKWRPFCSRRCKMIDLGNWLDEIYKVSRPLGESDFAAGDSMLGSLYGAVTNREK